MSHNWNTINDFSFNEENNNKINDFSFNEENNNKINVKNVNKINIKKENLNTKINNTRYAYYISLEEEGVE